MKKKIHFKEKIRRFHEWQQKPYVVAPLSEQEHECATCGTHYTGNFCPRCGQSQRIRRYSFKTAILNFLDVWGLGNRGMFRTIRDLLLRPGYMIRDYLSGMQMAYFPPFKLFFLLAALSILVTSGINIKGKNFNKEDDKPKAQMEKTVDSATPETIPQYQDGETDLTNLEDIEASERATKVFTNFRFLFDSFGRLVDRFPNLFSLLMLMFDSVFLYLFFRHCPHSPDLRFSELFVAMVYIADMYLILSTVLNFFCIRELSFFLLLLAIIPLKQLSGYSWWGTIWRALLAHLLLFVATLLIIAMVAVGVILCVQWFG
ncbi:MAG: DUF3667 domain-containing protein [Bacteroidales bacterium]|nr:DUF3667 domain-containing protein [Bacteroidales bacterium]